MLQQVKRPGGVRVVEREPEALEQAENAEKHNISQNLHRKQ